MGNASWVREVCFSARGFGADEAKTEGLVSRVVEGGRGEVLRSAMEWACGVAGKSPVAVQGTKELLGWSRERTVADGEFFFFGSFPFLLSSPARNGGTVANQESVR